MVAASAVSFIQDQFKVRWRLYLWWFTIAIYKVIYHLGFTSRSNLTFIVYPTIQQGFCFWRLMYGGSFIGHVEVFEAAGPRVCLHHVGISKRHQLIRNWNFIKPIQDWYE